MADPLTPDDVEHEDDRDRYERRLEQRLELERYAPLASRSDSDVCPTCLKPAYAAETCCACGDEEQAA